MGEAVEGANAGREVIQTGEVFEVAVAAAEDLAQILEAVDGLLDGARARVAAPCRCSTLRWCVKAETSLVVVSMRRTRPNLSQILSLLQKCGNSLVSWRWSEFLGGERA